MDARDNYDELMKLVMKMVMKMTMKLVVEERCKWKIRVCVVSSPASKGKMASILQQRKQGRSCSSSVVCVGKATWKLW